MQLHKVKKILVPTDFSKPCEAALKVAAAFGKQIGAKIELLHVYQAPKQTFGGGLLVSSDEALEELGAYFERKLRARAERLARAGLRVARAVRQGSAPQEICAHARKGKFELIIMGTHGRGGLDYALVGSVAERVLQHAPCAVLVVPAHKR